MDKLEIYNAVVERLSEDGCEASVYEDYSGRFMYGSTTPAIVTDASPAVVGAAIALEVLHRCEDPSDVEDRIWKLVPNRSDSMGLSQSVYY